ncbi:hypothetical protein [Clostridium estertheticum]|nr:hypothetical protein [Clostridium estertheticum]
MLNILGILGIQIGTKPLICMYLKIIALYHIVIPTETYFGIIE